MGVFPGSCANCASAQRRDGGSVSRYVFKLPDLGEGTVEAEIVGWRVKAGDSVAEDDVLVEVMTEKAAVEVPSPVTGRVVTTTGAPGDMVPVGAELIVLETQSGAASEGATKAPAGGNGLAHHGVARPEDSGEPGSWTARAIGAAAHGSALGAGEYGARVMSAPAIRRRAHE